MRAASAIVRLCRLVLGGVLIALAVPPAIWGIWLIAIPLGLGYQERTADWYLILGGTGLFVAANFVIAGILMLMGTVRREAWLALTVLVGLSAIVPYAGLPIREFGYFVNAALTLLALLSGTIAVLVWRRQTRCGA